MKFNKIYRTVLLVLSLIFISCGIWSAKMKFFQMDKLEGFFEQHAVAELNVSNWFSGDYQKSLDEYIIMNTHISPFFIKLSNQIDYSLFGKLHGSQGVTGKDGNLFQRVYIEAYYGQDFCGEDYLTEYVKKMKFIQDTLQKLNKEFIYIQAPGKASFYPEYIPDSMRRPVVATNYDVLSKLLDEYKVKHIDFKPFFLANKNKSQYPLYTRTGIHWSKYAMALVMDSMTRFIERDKNIDMANLYWDDMEVTPAQYEDKDLESIMNLLYPMYSDKYAYPILKVEPLKGKVTPKMLMIGDSYMGNLYWDHYFESYDSTSQYWFYNNSVYSLSFPDKRHKYQLNQIDVINKSDIIMLGCTEPNIRGMSWNFIDKVYDYYKYGKLNNQVDIDFLSDVDSTREVIKAKGLFGADINAISNNQHISLDSALTVQSLWVIDQKRRTIP